MVAVDVPRPGHHDHDPVGQLQRRLPDDGARPAGQGSIADLRRQPLPDAAPAGSRANVSSLLEITGLRTEIATPRGPVRPVDDVTFSVAAGETVGLVGESGSGKTMTGMSIIRLLPAGGSIVAGSIRFDGVELTELDAAGMRALRGSAIAMISQDPMTSLNPTRTIGSQLREAYRIHTAASRRAATERAVDVLGMVGMPK